ncbi:MAG TPA: rhodanese-like domain-containing protein [Cyclobacteriaceae bacterium]|nr:rhodanese-like domain-containing protein [Cyclobacteriaceae bacterium]
MKVLLVPMIALTLFSFYVDQDKEYVCTPCGLDCDHKVYNKPGKCSACGMALVEKSSVHVKDLTLEELCARLAANPRAVLLDVRSPREFNGTSMMRASFGHFKNAININVTELESRVGELSQYKDQEILVYCSHSQRSPRAAYFLSTRGFSNVKNMAGGVSTLADKQDNACLKKNFVFH